MNKLVAKIKQASIALVLFSTPVFAVDRSILYGEWGTEQQCLRTLITPQGTKHAAPFDIGPDWLSHGDVWCRLIWSTVNETPHGAVAWAKTLCGEDSVRDYQIKLQLTDDALTVIWNLQFKNGPLSRCTAG